MKNIVIQDSINLTEKYISKKYVLIVTIWLCSLFIFIGYTLGSLDNHPNIIEKTVYSDNYLIQQYNEPFSEEALIRLLTKLKVQHLDIVLKQSKIETGYYKSKVFIENNNLFGMRLPKQRITTALGENLNHATYDSWQDSVIDYAIYQSTYLRKMNKKEYIQYLKVNYAEDKQYINLINKL